MELRDERKPMTGEVEEVYHTIDLHESSDESSDLGENTDKGGEALIMVLLQQNLWDSDAIVVKLALQGLSDICNTANDDDARQDAATADAHYRRFIGRHDGPRIIAHAMERFASDADIQTEGLLALGNVICDDAKNKLRLFAMGATRGTVRTMRLFINHNHVQEYGCLLLRNLSCGPGGNAKIVADAGGIQAIVQAMEAFPGNGYTQRDAAAALWNMAEVSEELRVTIIRSGGPELIKKALQEGNYSENGNIVKRCANAALEALLG